jgi:short-subunit dehydrogenase
LSESIGYELEPFGIKVVLIEPGFVKTNFANAMVLAKNSQDPASPYLQMMQRIVANSTEATKSGSSADLVSKVIIFWMLLQIQILNFDIWSAKMLRIG